MRSLWLACEEFSQDVDVRVADLEEATGKMQYGENMQGHSDGLHQVLLGARGRRLAEETEELARGAAAKGGRRRRQERSLLVQSGSEAPAWELAKVRGPAST